MAPIQNRQEAADWRQKYGPAAPKAGDPAPDFELHDISGDDSIRLSQILGEQPVVLIFGSFT
jgi:hypothetical protein